MEMTFIAYQYEQAVTDNPEIFDRAKASTESTLTKIHKNFDVSVDRGVFENVMPFYTENVDVSIYDKTAFTNLDSALKLFEGTSEEIIKKLNKDAAYAYAKPLIAEFYNTLNPEFEAKNEPITALQTEYMTALMKALPDRSEEHTSELQSRENLVCRLLLEKKNTASGSWPIS